jgi:hypothetical protein
MASIPVSNPFNVSRNRAASGSPGMRVLMIEVMDQCYDFLMELCSRHGDTIVGRPLA